jgi:hypothetical protein
VAKSEVDSYLATYQPMQLRYNKVTKVNENYDRMNFGTCKGLSFNRTLIYPTKDMLDWLKDKSTELKATVRAKFYVAMTRARYSVGIVCDEEIENQLLSRYNG